VPDPPLLRRVCLDTVKEDVIRRVFTITDRAWRGIGTIPASGLALADEFARYDAESRFAVTDITPRENAACIASDILTGAREPTDCAAYGTTCTPRSPLGAPMVSTKGTCAAYHNAGRRPGAPAPFPSAARPTTTRAA